MAKGKLLNKWLLIMMVSIIGLTTSCRDDDDPVSGEGKEEEQVKETPIWHFAEPYLVWGKNMATVKSYMNKFNLIYEDGSTLLYEGGSTEACIAYNFEDGKLTMASVQIHEEDVTDREKLTADTFKGCTKTKHTSNYSYVDGKNNTVGTVRWMVYCDVPYIVFMWHNCKVKTLDNY